MLHAKTLLQATIAAVIGLVPVACAPQQSQPAAQGRTMQGSDMQAMMAQCAAMRRQMAEGTHPNTPGMPDMMAHCDEMDRDMEGTPGLGSANPTAAPAATRSR